MEDKALDGGECAREGAVGKSMLRSPGPGAAGCPAGPRAGSEGPLHLLRACAVLRDARPRWGGWHRAGDCLELPGAPCPTLPGEWQGSGAC